MTKAIKLDRRSFFLGAAAAGAGLSIGLDLSGEAQAATAPEINAWVVVKPDDTVVVRVVRSEMGQGSLYGLRQRMLSHGCKCRWQVSASGKRARPQRLVRTIAPARQTITHRAHACMIEGREIGFDLPQQLLDGSLRVHPATTRSRRAVAAASSRSNSCAKRCPS